MIQRILIPLDLTDKHDRAIALGAELATPSGGTVTLLHVIETIPGLSDDEEKDFYARLERAARKHLDGLSRDLVETCNVEWKSSVVSAPPDRTLCRGAESRLNRLDCPAARCQPPNGGLGQPQLSGRHPGRVSGTAGEVGERGVHAPRSPHY